MATNANYRETPDLIEHCAETGEQSPTWSTFSHPSPLVWVANAEAQFAAACASGNSIAFDAATKGLTAPSTSQSQHLRHLQHFHADLVRDIFGNPFREIEFNSEWRSHTVNMLADTIYNEHRFEDMPILADALEDAGCTDDDVLSHCRGEGRMCVDAG